MVANGLTPADLEDPGREIAFPESVIALFRGELGFPPDGFPAALSRRVLRAEPPAPFRPGDTLAPVDFAQARLECERAVGRSIDDRELASWLMYPKVFTEFARHQQHYGDVSVLPTQTFFYGMKEREEIAFDIDPGKTLVIRLSGSAPAEDEGVERLFFELNGQARTMRIEKSGRIAVAERPRAVDGDPSHIPAPMPGLVVTVGVQVGQRVRAGDPLASIEAMKMESQIRAERDLVIKAVHVKVGDVLTARDLMFEVV
jgi:pyruvate carboxylase